MKTLNQIHKIRALIGLAALLFLNGCVGPQAKTSDPTTVDRFSSLLSQGQSNGFQMPKALGAGADSYTVLVHSPKLLPLIKGGYSSAELQQLRESLTPTLAFSLDQRGLARAADRFEEGQADPTNYDAIWVRDSLWVYLGLKSDPRETRAATRLLLSLADYFASPDQLKRFETIIQDPSKLNGEDGPMNVVHIRFDGRSPIFQDVQVEGKAQKWNHKQNDALGLFLDLYSRALASGEITEKDLTPARERLFSLFPKYFAAVRFYQMEDAGSWEEIERLNTSSVALVTSGLERLSELTARTGGANAAQIKRILSQIDKAQLGELIEQGYKLVRKQIALGGESPSYKPDDPRHRTADAALLNVLYPARLSRLTKADHQRIVEAVQPLVGEIGIKRYLKDSYQSGNFWFPEQLRLQVQAAGKAANTGDTSSAQDFLERGKQFIDGSEAQWFFDSWYSVVMGELYQRYKRPEYLKAQVKFLNRALAQITGGSPEQPVLGADGLPVAAQALPESYNTVVDPVSGARVFAPSPITPLNWSKASLRLALQRLIQEPVKQ